MVRCIVPLHLPPATTGTPASTHSPNPPAGPVRGLNTISGPGCFAAACTCPYGTCFPSREYHTYASYSTSGATLTKSHEPNITIAIRQVTKQGAFCIFPFCEMLWLQGTKQAQPSTGTDAYGQRRWHIRLALDHMLYNCNLHQHAAWPRHDHKVPIAHFLLYTHAPFFRTAVTTAAMDSAGIRGVACRELWRASTSIRKV